MNKSKQISAVILHFVLVCLIALSIVFLAPACNKVPTENGGNKHSEHTYVYSVLDNENHKKTCSGCSDVNETEAHNFDSAQGKTCNDCGHVKTPSGLKVSVSKTALTAGDEFTVSLEISANMPGYNWHSISLLFTALDSNDLADIDVIKNFEYVSHTAPSKQYFTDSSRWNIDENVPAASGMLVSLSNRNIRSEQTLATQKITFEFTLKVKDDATAVQSLNFGVVPIKAYYVRFRNNAESTTVVHQADNVTVVNNVEDSEAGNCLTMPEIALSISAKAN